MHKDCKELIVCYAMKAKQTKRYEDNARLIRENLPIKSASRDSTIVNLLVILVVIHTSRYVTCGRGELL